MMRSALRATAGVAALGAAIFITPIPAHADGEYLRITPSTVQAGFQIEIEGYCGDNVNPATVKSDAFGTVTISPTPDQRTGKFLHRGTATVPTDKPAKAYPVAMTCPSQQSATTTLHVVNFNVPSRGPMTGGGFLANKPLGANGYTLAGVAALALGSLLLFVKRRKQRT
jgi:LPXTG-motif cell wall-anchored protein